MFAISIFLLVEFSLIWVITLQGLEVVGQTHDAYKVPFPLFPSFAENGDKKISVPLGQDAVLPCKIRNRYNYSLSWLRCSDLHILTVEDFSFTSDERFRALYQPSTREYNLQIKYVRKEDIGWYECQISSKPILRLKVFLEVLSSHGEKEELQRNKMVLKKKEPDFVVVDSNVWTEILHDKSDIYVNEGSLINITCRTSIADPSKTVFWYHQNHVISYYSLRGGVSLITDVGNHTISSLLIRNANFEDEGTYTCSPSNGVEAKIRVFVLEGNEIKATSHGDPRNKKEILLLLFSLEIVLSYVAH